MKTINGIVDFSCGNNCVVAITKTKEMFGLGSNEHGQLGNIPNLAK